MYISLMELMVLYLGACVVSNSFALCDFASNLPRVVYCTGTVVAMLLELPREAMVILLPDSDKQELAVVAVLLSTGSDNYADKC